jgi:hypothetical protein
MAVRRDGPRARSWQRWLDQNRDALIRCSLPEFVFSDDSRWLRFIEHGGWDHETGWRVEMLSPDQASALSDFITDQYSNEEYREILRVLGAVRKGPSGLHQELRA